MLVKISDGSIISTPYIDGEGNQYPPNMEYVWTDNQLAEIGLKRAPDPLPPPQALTFNDWLALFTPAEREWAFASNDPHVREMIERGAAVNSIDLSSPRVAAFCDLVIALGSPLTAERKARVLSGKAPL